MMDFDECLSVIGGFGTYQKIVIYLVLLPAVIPCAFHAYNQVFISATPDHLCLREAQGENDSLSLIQSGSVPRNESNKSSIYYWNYTGEVSGVGPKDCIYGWVYDRSTYEETVSTEWNLVCERDHYTMVSYVLFGAGGLVGSFVFGYLQDSFGRHPAFFLYILIETVFSVASAFANNYVIWTTLRFGVGFTVPAILGTPYVLSMELVGPDRRAFCAVLINIIYSIALVGLSAVVYLVREWRRLTLATTLPFGLFFFYWWVLPESPRWLVANGKFDEAEKILKKISKVNGKNWSEEYLQALKFYYEGEQRREKENQFGVADLFRYPKLRANTIIITLIWFANTAVYVGLSYYSPSLGGDEIFNFFLSGVVELPTYLFLLQAIEKGGRRWTLCISMMASGLACLGTLLFGEDHSLLIFLYCVGKMGISCSFVVLPLLASELYPTVVRGIGISFSSMVGQIGPIFIPIINYLGKDWMVLPLAIMGLISIGGGALSMLLPETLNLHLPQNLEDVDGKFRRQEEVKPRKRDIS